MSFHTADIWKLKIICRYETFRHLSSFYLEREREKCLIVMLNLRVNDTITMPTLAIAMETIFSLPNGMEKSHFCQGVVGRYVCLQQS